MLQSLHIHNFALIEDLHLTFGDGVTIFTGETGAGKSILLDAIGMLAGKRASASFVRHGTDSFLVEGAFFFSALPEGLEQLLEANHIEVDEGQLIISRQFPRSGRGTILVNGTLVPTATLRRLGEYLLDIHGQFDNSLIFNPSYHVAILDGLTADVRQARQDYDGLYRQWHETEGEIKALRHDESEKARMLSILAFQIKEIEGAALKEGEDDELEQKINKASHAEHIKDNLKEAMFALEGSERQPGVIEQIETIHRSLEKASAYDEAFSALAGKVETLSYEIEDVHDGLLRYADSFDFDERALDAMQSRLASIEKLKRKYGFTVADILQFLAKAKADYERLDQSESHLAKLEEKLAREAEAVRQQAQEHEQHVDDVQVQGSGHALAGRQSGEVVDDIGKAGDYQNDPQDLGVLHLVGGRLGLAVVLLFLIDQQSGIDGNGMILVRMHGIVDEGPAGLRRT